MNKDELTTDGTNNNANGQTVPKMEVEVSSRPHSTSFDGHLTSKLTQI